MKKNVLSLSIAAMLADMRCAAQADHETDRTELLPTEQLTGNLLVPYFNAQHGSMSVFHVANTAPLGGKPVKVRFRSAPNPDDILDFRTMLTAEEARNYQVSEFQARALDCAVKNANLEKP